MTSKELKSLFNNVEIAININSELQDVLQNILSHKPKLMEIEKEESISQREVLKTLQDLSTKIGDIINDKIENEIKNNIVEPIEEPQDFKPDFKYANMDTIKKEYKLKSKYHYIEKPRITLKDLFPEADFEGMVNEKPKEKIIEEPKPLPNPNLFIHIGGLGMSYRATQSLLKGGFTTIGGLMESSESELMRLRNMGKITLDEIKNRLKDFGLKLKKK
jgi:hypothetical protein